MEKRVLEDLAPYLAEKLARDGLSWREAPYIHEDVRRVLEEEYWNSMPLDNAIIDPDSSYETRTQAAWLQSQIDNQQRQFMMARVCAELTNVCREYQDDAESILFADNVPVLRCKRR